MISRAAVTPYLQLMRLDRPVGTLLLLWPTLSALWMAAGGMPPLGAVLVFTLGTFFMRAAGCVVNDFADRGWDGAVERTRDRPLATGRITAANAMLLFAGLVLAAFCLLLFLNDLARWLAVGGLALAVLYPFMKRWTYLPQVILGTAFSWALIMAFAQVTGAVPTEAWLYFVCSVLWIVAYDTQYAMVDRNDDLKVGIKSTAILFGNADRFMIGVLQAAALIGLLLLGEQLDYGWSYQLALAVCAGLFVYQQVLIYDRSRNGCFRAFLNNIWVGFSLFCGVVAEVTVVPWLSGLPSAP